MSPRFKEVSARSKEELVAQGFTEFTIEDFHNTVGTRGDAEGGGDMVPVTPRAMVCVTP